MLPYNPNKQSQIHHADHKLHKTAGQKANEGTCGSLECPMMVFVIVDKFANKSANKRTNDKSEWNRSNNPHNQTDICSPNAVGTSAKFQGSLGRNDIIQYRNHNGYQEANP